MTGNRIYYAHLKCHDWDDTLCFRGEKGANSFRKKIARLANNRERRLVSNQIKKEIYENNN
ncbi:MAG: hypothetical protein II937_13530 [Bacteroidales bacterium]|nr:hypothetical protein [Bacteroidales bacterium]